LKLLYGNLKKLSLSLVLIGVACVAGVHAQVVTPKLPTQPPPDAFKIEPARRQAPQVVTIVHRLNGIKALALLRRSGETVALIDDELVTATDAVTSITAGFALGDGQSIVARLPQAEIEALTSAQPSSMTWSYSTSLSAFTPKIPTGQTPPARRSEFVVVESNGKQFVARYVGLDGVSGLSLLKIKAPKVPLSRDAGEEQLIVGQRVRLFAQVRVARGGYSPQGTVAVRVGELEGKITEITRTSTGKVAHISVSAQNLSPAIVGGVALNEAGETVGIVDASDAAKARVIPSAVVRRAVSRVQSRQASVPRPWLGVRGEPVTAISLEKFHSIGWSEVEAAKLKEAYKGILLTSVAPGTPAAMADLRPGDVIVRVNNVEVKSPEDFSFVLNEAGGGATVNFTFFRGQNPEPFFFTPSMPPMAIQTPQPIASPGVVPPQLTPAGSSPVFAPLQPHKVSVKLSEALNPARAMKLAEAYASGGQTASTMPSIARGLEAVTLSAKAATHLGSRGGVLVVFVDPESAAARAGLRVFDVIESVNGKLLGRTSSWSAALPAGTQQQLQLGVVRDRQKVEIIIRQKDAPKK
jgi:S1-C subfamily serine protease